MTNKLGKSADKLTPPTLNEMTAHAIRKQRVQDFISGKAEPPNTIVEYIIVQMENTQQEAKVIQKNISQLTARLQQLQNRLIELQGIYDKYAVDLENWDRDLKESDLKIDPKGER